MKRENLNYTIVGLVVLGGIVLLMFALFAITGERGSTASYFVTYRNVTGLTDGAPVFYEGYRIGDVESITPSRKDGKISYRIELGLRRDWPIPTDSVARLVSSGLLADVSIAIREGAAKEALPEGADITGQEGADMFAAINELASEVTDLTRTKITPLIQSLSLRVDSITGAIDQKTPEILAEAQKLLQKLNEVATSTNEMLGPVNRENVAQTLANIREVTGDLKETSAKLDTLLDNASAIAVENRPVIRDAVRDLAQITASLARRIDAISHNLESSSRNFDEFTREIRKAPNRLLLTPKADDVRVEDE